jgi:hypothetical protein
MGDIRQYPEGRGSAKPKYVNGTLTFHSQILVPGVTAVLRTRVTTANVNAGYTLLEAIPGYKYRLVDCTLIAYGGAAATADSVDILATLSSSRKLVSAAVAALGQSVVARVGDSNVDALADGASFTANDANTAITIGKTGSSLATATGIDVLLQYTIEAA